MGVGRSTGTNALPTPIKVNKLGPLLANYDDKKFVIEGLTTGFDLGYQGEQASQRCNNNLTVNANPDTALAKVNKEVSLNRIAGPFKDVPFPHFKCSPLALREKSTPGQYRLLHNLSHPHDDTAVNANIPRELTKVTYATVEDATEIIRQFDAPFLAKTDIADAFRLLPLNPECYNLTGFKLQGYYYYDKCVPMGASSSCQTFERFSDALLHILKSHYQVKHIVKVLDDFLLIGESRELCQHALDSFTHLAHRINLPLAAHKTEGPTQCLTFLGIQIDTLKGELSIPQGKIIKYTSDILAALKTESVTLKELQSLTGKLQFVSTIVPVGRSFLRRLYDLSINKRPHATIKLGAGAMGDLVTWLTFLKDYNAKELYLTRLNLTTHTDHIYTDSSDIGYGGTFRNEYFYGEFPRSWLEYDIQVREFFPILLLITIKADCFANSHLTIRTDNSSVAAAINTQTSKNKNLMQLLRKFVLSLLKNNIKCTAYHIAGKKNTISDALSRLQLTKALFLYQQLGYKPKPLPVPSSRRPGNWSLF